MWETMWEKTLGWHTQKTAPLNPRFLQKDSALHAPIPAPLPPLRSRGAHPHPKDQGWVAITGCRSLDAKADTQATDAQVRLHRFDVGRNPPRAR